MKTAVLGVLMGFLLGCGGEDDRPAETEYIAVAILNQTCGPAPCHSDLTQIGSGIALDSVDNVLDSIELVKTEFEEEKANPPSSFGAIERHLPLVTDCESDPACDPADPNHVCDPEQSLFHQTLRGDGTFPSLVDPMGRDATFDRMPPDNAMPERDLDLIDEWLTTCPGDN